MTIDKRYLDTLGVEQIFKLIKQNYVLKSELGEYDGDLQTALATLDEKLTKYTDDEVAAAKKELQDALDEAIQAAEETHLARTIVETLPAAADADARTIYMVKDAQDGTDEANVYTEWMLIDGEFERIGSTAVDLADYAKSQDVEDAIEEVNATIETLTADMEAADAQLSQDIADAAEKAAKDLADFKEEAQEGFVKEANFITQQEVVAMFYSDGTKTVVVDADMNATVVDDIAAAIAEAPANSLVYVNEDVTIPAGTEIADGVTIIANGGTIVC